MTEIKFGDLIGVPDPRVSRILERAKIAEKCGYDSFWMADHILSFNEPVPETWTVLTAVAMITKRIKLCTGVSDPHRRNPAVFAQTVATLDQISNGRVVVGLGPGEAMNLEPFGISWNKPVTRMVEAVELMRRLWIGEVIDHKSEFFKFKGAKLQIKPIQKPYPPIYFGANSPRTREIVGEIGEGIVSMDSPQLFKKHMKDIEKGLANSGRGMDEIDPCLWGHTAVDSDGEKAFKHAEMFVRPLGATMSPKLKEQYGVDIPREYLINEMEIAEDTPWFMSEFAMKYVPPEYVRNFNVVGTPEECIEQIDKFVKGGVRHFALLNVGPHTKEVYRIYKEEIIPYFRQQYTE
jgi:5,10-methylenetetrahydromethanopterin reductase